MYSLLLVDDEKAVLDGLLHAVDWNELGFDTINLASDGQSALELVQKNNYHIVITDIRMPNMDGLALLKAISAQSNIRTRVIILTAYNEFDYVLTALRSGAANFLMKPIDTFELRTAVLDALEAFKEVKPCYESEQNTFEEYLLRRWLNEGADYPGLDTRASMIGINIFLRYYNVMILSAPEASVNGYAQKIQSMVAELGDCRMLRERPDMLVFIVGGHNADEPTLSKALLSLNEQMADDKASLLIGKAVTFYKDVSKCYKSCLMILNGHELKYGVQTADDFDLSQNAAESSTSAIEQTKEHTSVIQRALDYIEKHYSCPLSLNLIADELGLNTNYLGFQFHRELGEYFSDYLNSFRIRRAQQLLRETDLPVAVISIQVGYTSVNYFCQVFKKQVHQSPVAYRRSTP